MFLCVFICSFDALSEELQCQWWLSILCDNRWTVPETWPSLWRWSEVRRLPDNWVENTLVAKRGGSSICRCNLLLSSCVSLLSVFSLLFSHKWRKACSHWQKGCCFPWLQGVGRHHHQLLINIGVCMCMFIAFPDDVAVVTGCLTPVCEAFMLVSTD